jgi:molybdopterin molybdotransferase
MTDALVPPRLKDDCFAMPQGVAWVPVDAAQARLQENLRSVVGHETVAIGDTVGRILAEPVVALA